MSARPRLLDLFCGAGGAAVGYDRAARQRIEALTTHPQYASGPEWASADDFKRRALEALGGSDE